MYWSKNNWRLPALSRSVPMSLSRASKGARASKYSRPSMSPGCKSRRRRLAIFASLRSRQSPGTHEGIAQISCQCRAQILCRTLLKDELRGHQLRLVKVQRTNDEGELETWWLLTNKLDLPAELVALGYRYRWTVELFFRWLKCVLGWKQLLTTSENGVALQIYTALIASLLIVLWTGRKPTKRTWEMLQFYFQGWASLDEVEAHLEKQKRIALKNQETNDSSDKA